MLIDGLIFDLDGTIWDASASCIRAWNNTLQEFGLGNTRVDQDRVAIFSGRLLEDILTREFPALSQQDHEAFILAYAAEEARQMKESGGYLYPGMRETLELLALRFPLFIVSNCQRGYIENFLTQHGLESFFRDFECSGNTGQPKQKNLQSLIERNKLARPAYVGDTQTDREASLWNGIPFIHAAYGFGRIDHAEYRISHPSELLGKFE